MQVAKRNELYRFEVMPQRWVVERSSYRELSDLENCERQLTTSLQMVVLALTLYLRDLYLSIY